MRLGILRAGGPPPGIGADVPSYPTMFRAALGSTFTYREFDVQAGYLPGTISSVDAYVVTGSHAGVYDGDPWIGRFRDWLKEVGPKTPLVGICFGHQIMAEAYGGVVKKSSNGWTGGLHEYKVRFHQSWMDNVERIVLPVAHQDQVVIPPSTARVIATSDLCPYAALAYHDRRAVSFQGHPEFPLDYSAKLIDWHQRNGSIGNNEADKARDSMRKPDDRTRVATWIRQFLQMLHE